MKSQDNDGLWADSPIESGAQDSFDRLRIAESTARLLNSSSNSESSVVAYIGPWGCGKTSLINMTIEKLTENNGSWKVAYFSPWATSDVEGMMNEFYVTLRSVLPIDKDKKLQKLLANVIPVAASISKSIPVIGGSLNKAADLAVKKLETRNPWNEEFQKLDRELSFLPYKILIVADDIDRLQEDELRVFFKLIRLIGNLSNVFYLVAYDNDAIVGTLSGNFSSSYDARQIDKYIEKFIQFPIHIPQVSELFLGDRLISEIRECIPKYFDTIDSVFYDNLLVFVTFLNTPRSLTRFINQFKIHVSHYDNNDINYSELLVLTLIKLHFPILYSEIYKHNSILTKVVIPLGSPNSAPDFPKGIEYFDNFVENFEDINKIQKNSAKLLIASLFPTYSTYLVDIKKENDRLAQTLIGSNSQKGRNNKKVSISDRWSFHRYFDFGVDQYDVLESSIMDAIHKANNGYYIDIYSLISDFEMRLSDLLLSRLEDIVKDLLIQNRIENDVLSFVILLILRRLQRLDKFILDNFNGRWVADRTLVLICDFIENMDTNSYSYKDVDNIFNLRHEIHFETQFRLVNFMYRDVDAKFSSIKGEVKEIWHRYCGMAVDKLEEHLCEGDNADYNFPFLLFLTCVLESDDYREIISKRFKRLYVERKISPDDYISRFVVLGGGNDMGDFDDDVYQKVTSFDLDDPKLGYDDYFDVVDDLKYGAPATWKNRAIFAKQFLSNNKR